MLLLRQLFCGALAILLSIWTKMPLPGVVAVAVLASSAVAAARVSKLNTRLFALAVVAGMTVPLSYFFPRRTPYTWDIYYAVFVWLLAAVCFPTGRSRPLPTSRPSALWKGFGFFWCFCGAVVICITGYDRNLLGLFYLGGFLLVLLLLVLKRISRFGMFGSQVANTFLLLLVGLPVADWFTIPAYRLDVAPDPSKTYYSFEAARRDPSAFRRWWRYYINQWDGMAGKIYTPDPEHLLPFRLKPNSESTFFNCKISINSLGFRGKEVLWDKGNAYRIVAVGESTTFGATINKKDKPWPDVLEEIIRERLNPARPVQVINAGVPSYTIRHNLSRLSSEIFRLRPDMIVCYHGYNGFGFLHGAVPAHHTLLPPAYVERPVKLFAKIEYNVKLGRLKRRLAQNPLRESPTSVAPLSTPCAEAYECLIDAARTNGIRLAIANFAMAVTTNTPREVMEFYRGGFPSVYWSAEANAAHSELVQQLARKHPEIALIDMHPGLDGEHEKFIDIVHMTQVGRQQAAENVFVGIRSFLEQDLKPATASSTP